MPPRRADGAACSAAFGAGALCFDAEQAIHLSALLGVLTDMYFDRLACDPAPPK